MAGALLYQPRQSWRVGIALGTAALIHFAAVAIASIYQNTQMEEVLPGQDEFPIVDIIDPSSPTEESTPPPDDVTAPSPVPHPAEEPIFKEERPTPAPVRLQTDKHATPIVKVRNGVASGSLSLSSARVVALSAPRPEYPYEARRQKITGNGIVIMTVDSVSGSVTDVVMKASTGSSVLDNAAVTGFRRWRFKPGTVSRVKSPITFTMIGAQY
jgi:TonB family protein